MFFSFIFYLLRYAFDRNKEKECFSSKSFALITSHKKKSKLINPSYYINLEKSSIRSLSRKIMKNDDNTNESNWYYVHFLIQNLQKIKEIFNISIKDMVLRNSYILYLNINQLEKIQKISLVKKLEPSDKFFEDGNTIANTNFFHVVTAPNTSLPINQDLYYIFCQDFEQKYIIEIKQNGLNEQNFIKKKKEVINFITSIHSIKLISTFTFPKVKNNLITGYTQKNYPIQSINKDSQTGISFFPRYVNDNGITGKNQIITIQDTPIDPFHAMFRDDDYGLIDINKELTGHRKLVYYRFEGNSLYDLISSLEENEHGTHVACTAAGKSICNNDETKGTNFFNGNAPDAKILYAGDIRNVLGINLISLMNRFNSKISLNSWGTYGFNDMLNHQYGKIAYNNPELIFLFAAGNGFNEGYFTVNDPGGSKNVLTVGAIDDFYETIKTYQVESMNDSSILFKAYAIKEIDPWIEGTIGTLNETIIAIDAEKGNQCSMVKDNHITLLYSPYYEQFDWIYSCQSQNTKGILYTYSISSMEILIRIGGKIKITDISFLNASKGIKHAEYSSAGPASKGIIKPDVVAPGTRIISAKSHSKSIQHHGCRDNNEGDFTFMNGTSMATSNLAGAVALVREFFQSGRWGAGSVSLNSATMRALIINSCNHPHGSKKPDLLFGHGVVDLSTILPFDSSFGVQISDQENPPVINNGSFLVAQLEVKSNKIKIQVTLSYLDQMPEESSTVPIVNDLDLVLVSSSGRRFLGDSLHNNDTQHFSTNEKVIIDKDDIEVGTYYVYVVAGPFINYELSTESQKFAVVATGDIDNKYMIFGNPTANEESRNDHIFVNECPCENCSIEQEITCYCDDYHIGNLCQAEIMHISNDKSASLLIYPGEIGRIRVSNYKGVNEINTRVIDSISGNASLWIDNECHVSISEYKTYIDNSRLMSGKIKLDKMKDFCIAIFNNNYEQATFEFEFSLKESKKGLIIGICFGVIVFIVIIIVIVCVITKKRRSVSNYSNHYANDEIHHSESENSTSGTDITGKNKEISRITSDNLSLKASLSEKDREISRLTDENALLKADPDEKNREILNLRNENLELKDNITEKDREITRLTNENELLKNSLNKKDSEIKPLADENESLKASLAEKDSEISELKGKNSKLKKELKKKEKEIAEIKSPPIKLLEVGDIEKKGKKIGSGGTSEVYELINSVKMALKIINIEADDPNRETKIQKLFQEYETINSLNHPNIIKTYGMFIGDETHKPAILLEYCETDLKKKIKDLNETKQIEIIVNLSSAMKLVHSKNIIHRDLKPENILLNSNNEMKLADFGLCTLIDNDESTKSHTINAGTMNYMAPEIALGKKDYTEKVDVYSFGIVVYMILTKGDRPENIYETAISGKELEFPSSISEFSSNLIKDCLSLDPKKRPSFDKICSRLKKNAQKLIK